jgi:hypothetical protein
MVDLSDCLSAADIDSLVAVQSLKDTVIAYLVFI